MILSLALSRSRDILREKSWKQEKTLLSQRLNNIRSTARPKKALASDVAHAERLGIRARRQSKGSRSKQRRPKRVLLSFHEWLTRGSWCYSRRNFNLTNFLKRIFITSVSRAEEQISSVLTSTKIQCSFTKK